MELPSISAAAGPAGIVCNRAAWQLRRHRDVNGDVYPKQDEHDPAREVRVDSPAKTILAEMNVRVRVPRGDVQPCNDLHNHPGVVGEHRRQAARIDREWGPRTGSRSAGRASRSPPARSRPGRCGSSASTACRREPQRRGCGRGLPARSRSAGPLRASGRRAGRRSFARTLLSNRDRHRTEYRLRSHGNSSRPAGWRSRDHTRQSSYAGPSPRFGKQLTGKRWPRRERRAARRHGPSRPMT